MVNPKTTTKPTQPPSPYDYDLPEGADDLLNRSTSPQGQRIELPFTHLKLWWMNGKSIMKATGGVLYFGGWGSNVPEMENAVADLGLDIPSGFAKITSTSRDNKDYDAYYARAVACAPIARRAIWVEIVDPVSQAKRGQSKVNYLVYLATFSKDKGYVPYGFATLSAKSYSGLKLDTAFKDWADVTADIRRAHTVSTRHPKGLPANFFWHLIGTFGPDPVFEQVGKGSNKSPITPVKALLPAEIGAGFLDKAAVGSNLATLFVDTLSIAKEWLDDWNLKKTAKETTSESPGDEPPPLEESSHYESEIPF